MIIVILLRFVYLHQYSVLLIASLWHYILLIENVILTTLYDILKLIQNNDWGLNQKEYSDKTY